jgi:hypothetical protein
MLVLARRIVAVSPDKAFGKQLATALKAAGGTVDLHPKLDDLAKGEITTALLVLHLEGEMATAAAEVLPRLAGDAKAICILPRSNLAAIVDVMQSSDRIAGIVIQENFDSRQLSAMATRVISGDIFGLEKMVTWGTLIHSQLVGDYQDKSLTIAQISEFAEMMGVRRKYREAIEQCIDEMMMNALYDAPVDEQGKQIFSEVPIKTRISLRVEQKVVVQYACDGKQFAVSVRDAFGTLERSTVLRYLYKCLHAEQQIDRKAGGAGLGLYLMANSATTVYFNVLTGVATEAVCVFDLESPKLQLEKFGFFTEKIDAGGRLAAGASRRLPTTGHPVERRRNPAPPPQPRGLIAVLSLAIIAVLALVGVAAYPRFFPGTQTAQVTFTTIPKGATIEIEGRNEGTAADGTLVRELEIGRAYPVVAKLDGYEPRSSVVQPQKGGSHVTFELQARTATVVLDSQPTGATVEADGKVLGTTPLTLTMLKPGSNVQFVMNKTGYRPAPFSLDVPGPGKEVRMVQPLAISDELARVKLVSEPLGAQVYQNGQLVAGVQTPAEVLVEAGKTQRFMLSLPGYVPAFIEPFAPSRGAVGIVKTGKLVPGYPLRIETSTEGKIAISGAPHCKDLAPPTAECIVAAGTYEVDFVVQGNKFTRNVTVTNKAVPEKFDLGWVETNDAARLLVNGKFHKKLLLEAGPRTVTVSDEAGVRTVQVRVKAGGTVIAK